MSTPLFRRVEELAAAELRLDDPPDERDRDEQARRVQSQMELDGLLALALGPDRGGALEDAVMQGVRERAHERALASRTMATVRRRARAGYWWRMSAPLLAASLFVGLAFWHVAPPSSPPPPRSETLLAWTGTGLVADGVPGRFRTPQGAVLVDGAGGRIELAPGSVVAIPPHGSADRLALQVGALVASVAPGRELDIDTPTARARSRAGRFTLTIENRRPSAMPRPSLLAVLLVGVLELSNSHGVLLLGGGDVARADESSAPVRAASGLVARFGRRYEPVTADAPARIPAHALPLAPGDVANLDHPLGLLGADASVREALLARGMAIVPFGDHDGYAAAYKQLRALEVPIYVTSDSVLFQYHLQFDELLRELETAQLAGGLDRLLSMLATELRERAAQEGGSLDGGVGCAQALVAVARALLADRAPELSVLDAAQRAIEGAKDLNQAVRALGTAMFTQGDSRAYLASIPGLGDPGDARHPSRAPRGQQVAALRALLAEERARVVAHSEAAAPYLGLHEAVAAAARADLGEIALRAGWKRSEVVRYDEDFTQYVPRGHYTRSFPLARYFRAMMWLGRVTLLLTGGEPHGPAHRFLVSAAEARRQTAAAAYLARAIERATADGTEALFLWRRIETLTAFFVGAADDLGQDEYSVALADTVGDASPGTLSTEETWRAFQARVARFPASAIYGGTGNAATTDPSALAGEPTPEALDLAIDKARGYRLFGQRFTPDAYWLGRLVSPVVGRYEGKVPASTVFTGGELRKIPRGLDVMALLGSPRAQHHLEVGGDAAYLGYAVERDRLRAELAALEEPAAWNANLYWAWLHGLRGMMAPKGEGYPTVMRQPVWGDRELVASLASWTALKHDTILYAKQPYRIRLGGRPVDPRDVPGYVEPQPELYARLVALVRFTRRVLDDEQALSDGARARLVATETLFTRLLSIARTELASAPLSAEDLRFIQEFATQLAGVAVSTDSEPQKTTFAADVFTDAESGVCLEQATGPLALLLVANRLSDGTIAVSAGPIASYYEFTVPMAERLTDEAWRAWLAEAGEAHRDRMPAFARGLWGNR